MLNAHTTLQKARYFLAQARGAEADPTILSDRLPFAANLEAAIIYARSSLDHLHSELAPKHHVRGYRTWHDNKFNALKTSSPAFDYFTERRNFIIHQEPENTNAQVSMQVEISATTSVSLELTVVRADGTVEKRKSPPPSSEPDEKKNHSATRSVAFFFADPDWRAKAAVAYVADFIDLCDSFVAEANSKFP
jgi:hypothetical protein